MSFKSPFPDVEIPNLSVYDFLFGNTDPADLDKTAFVEGSSGAVTTYASLIAQINGVAGALAARARRRTLGGRVHRCGPHRTNRALSRLVQTTLSDVLHHAIRHQVPNRASCLRTLSTIGRRNSHRGNLDEVQP